MVVYRLEHGKKTGIARAVNRRRAQNDILRPAVVAHLELAGQLALPVFGDRTGRLPSRAGCAGVAGPPRPGWRCAPVVHAVRGVDGGDDVARADLVDLVELGLRSGPWSAPAQWMTCVMPAIAGSGSRVADRAASALRPCGRWELDEAWLLVRPRSRTAVGRPRLRRLSRIWLPTNPLAPVSKIFNQIRPTSLPILPSLSRAKSTCCRCASPSG